VTYYTYLWLREDGTPYYVGKGKGDRAFRKGSPSVERIILQEWPSESDAFAAEIFLIAFYGRKDNGTGILRNLSDGGEGPGGVIFTPEWRAKLSAAKRDVPKSPEHRARIAKGRTGKRHSASARAKMSAMKTGKKWTPKDRAKLSLAHRGYRHSPETLIKLRAAWVRRKSIMQAL